MRNGIQQDLENILVVGADEASLYRDTLENFSVDHGSEISALPEGITLRVYEYNVRHALIANNSVLDGGPMPWPEGNAIIATVRSLIAAQSARIAAAEANKKPSLDMGGSIYQVITQ